MTKIFNVIFDCEGGETETVTVEASCPTEARDAAEYELVRSRGIVSAREGGFTARRVVVVNPAAPFARQYAAELAARAHGDMVSDLRHGG